MRIEKVEIENFRCIEKEAVDLTNITAFLGRNGAGKSTVLYALDSFYDVAAQYSNLDYFKHVTDGVTIKIRVTFGHLLPDEIEEFGGYVHGEKLIVTKAITTGGVRYLGVSRQIPAFAKLRTLGARERRSDLAQMVEAGDLPGFQTPIPTRGEDVEARMEDYERENPQMTELVEREGTFFGPRNVGGGKLDKFTKFVLVPAVRDASSEMERRGAVMQLLELIVSRSIASRRDFQEFREQFEQRARELYGRENLPELAQLGLMVTERLARYAPGASLSVNFDELKAPTIPLPTAVIEIAEDEFPVPVRYTGHGLQRALILALLEQLSLTESSMRNMEQSDGEESAPSVRPPSLILAIEEPELYLHPGRSKFLAKVLRTLAGYSDEDGIATSQVVYVSHSPYFVSVENFDEIRICRKSKRSLECPPSTRLTKFSASEAAAKLAEIYGRNSQQYTQETFVARASPVLNSIVNEGLFADAVVVVEGESDVAALWAMQEALQEKWDEKGIVVVPVGGKNNIDRAVIVFKGFEIPTYFMFDGDRNSDDPGVETNKALLALGGETRSEYPAEGVYGSCAAFERDLESYLKSVMSHDFERIRNRSAEALGHDRPSKALKNSQVMRLFLETAQSEGHRFDHLEQIVRKVTSLVGVPPVDAAHGWM